MVASVQKPDSDQKQILDIETRDLILKNRRQIYTGSDTVHIFRVAKILTQNAKIKSLAHLCLFIYAFQIWKYLHY